GAILEGWSTLAFLAGRTRQIQLGSIHLAHLFRSPTLTAKMVATLDTLSDGRLIFFYDVGGLGAEATAYGFPALSWPERIARFDEALGLICQLWTATEPVTFLGKYYQTDSAICLPSPRQRPTPPIWLGEVREDPWTDVVCKHATGWNSTPTTVDGYREKLEKLGAAARRVGRDLGSFDQSLEIEVMIAPDRPSVRALADQIAALPAAGPARPRLDLVEFLQTSDPQHDWRLPASFEGRALVGTPDEVVDRIRQYQALGVSHFMLWFLDFPSTAGLRLFAEKVLPALR
ncbi:MAG TPA: LLM class flavin-dependent oxidoreductase, partial [Chloroflexota bacterium]|nr:LLM class flavin-dependent oxidoreductase [Chloroflexota bacterium]